MYILARGKGLHTYNSAKKGQLYVFRCRKSGFFAYNTAENGQLYVFVISGILNVSHSEKLHLSKTQKAERGRASACFFACKMEDMRVKWRGNKKDTAGENGLPGCTSGKM